MFVSQRKSLHELFFVSVKLIIGPFKDLVSLHTLACFLIANSACPQKGQLLLLLLCILLYCCILFFLSLRLRGFFDKSVEVRYQGMAVLSNKKLPDTGSCETWRETVTNRAAHVHFSCSSVGSVS